MKLTLNDIKNDEEVISKKYIRNRQADKRYSERSIRLAQYKRLIEAYQMEKEQKQLSKLDEDTLKLMFFSEDEDNKSYIYRVYAEVYKNTLLKDTPKKILQEMYKNENGYKLIDVELLKLCKMVYRVNRILWNEEDKEDILCKAHSALINTLFSNSQNINLVNIKKEIKRYITKNIIKESAFYFADDKAESDFNNLYNDKLFTRDLSELEKVEIKEVLQTIDIAIIEVLKQNNINNRNAIKDYLQVNGYYEYFTDIQMENLAIYLIENTKQFTEYLKNKEA